MRYPSQWNTFDSEIEDEEVDSQFVREIKCHRCYGTGEDDDEVDCVHCDGYGTILV